MQDPSVYAKHAKELRAQINEAELKVLSLYSILAETERLEKEAIQRMNTALYAAMKEEEERNAVDPEWEKKCADKRFKTQIWPRHPGMDDEAWRQHVDAAMGNIYSG